MSTATGMKAIGSGRLIYMRKTVCPVPRLLQDDVVPNFHITPFLPLSRCDLVYCNPMVYGTQNATKSVHHPVVHLRIRRLRLTRLQVITEKGQSEKHYRDTAEEDQSNQELATPAECRTIPPKVQEASDRHWYDA
jgi:hypothetical protein